MSCIALYLLQDSIACAVRACVYIWEDGPLAFLGQCWEEGVAHSSAPPPRKAQPEACWWRGVDGARPAPHFRQIYTRLYGRCPVRGSGSPLGRTLDRVNVRGRAASYLYVRTCQALAACWFTSESSTGEPAIAEPRLFFSSPFRLAMGYQALRDKCWEEGVAHSSAPPPQKTACGVFGI